MAERQLNFNDLFSNPVLQTQIRKIQNEIDRTEAKIEMSSTVETTTKRRGKGKDDKKAEKEVDYILLSIFMNCFRRWTS